MRATALLAFVAASTLCLGAPALAQRNNNPLIEEGADQYDELRYEEALQTLSAALVRAGNTREQQARIYELLAFTYLSLGREAEAEGAYRSLLAIQPNYEAGADMSPRFREFFGGVKQRWEQEGRPGGAPPAPASIQHTSPAQADPGEAVELRATLDDPSGRIVSVVLAYRQGTSDVYRRLDTELVDGEHIATIPGDDVAPPLVEYYFEGLDANGLPVASRGDVAAPLRIAVEGDSGGIATKWWFWTILGVAVVGAVVTAVILTRDDGGPGSDPQGTFVITIGE